VAKEPSEQIIWDEERGEPGFGFIRPHFHQEIFPTSQIVGYVLSLALTLTSFLLVIHRTFSASPLLVAILILAVGQAGVQVGIFMHLRESRGPAWQVIPLFLGFFIAGGMIAMSIWIMMFKWGGY